MPCFTPSLSGAAATNAFHASGFALPRSVASSGTNLSVPKVSRSKNTPILRPANTDGSFAFLRERHRIDAERFQEPAGHRAVGIGAVDIERAAIDQQHAAVDVDLVALGVTAEIVVVLEDLI